MSDVTIHTTTTTRTTTSMILSPKTKTPNLSSSLSNKKPTLNNMTLSSFSSIFISSPQTPSLTHTSSSLSPHSSHPLTSCGRQLPHPLTVLSTSTHFPISRPCSTLTYTSLVPFPLNNAYKRTSTPRIVSNVAELPASQYSIPVTSPPSNQPISTTKLDLQLLINGCNVNPRAPKNEPDYRGSILETWARFYIGEMIRKKDTLRY